MADMSASALVPRSIEGFLSSLWGKAWTPVEPVRAKLLQ